MTDTDLRKWVADCCRTPAILQSEATGRPGEATGKCACCGVRWTFHDCTIDDDGLLVAGSVSRPKRNGDVLAETLHPRSAGRVIQLPKGKKL